MRTERLLVALLAAGALSAACSAPPSDSKGLRTGQPAPAFSLPSADGGSIALGDLRGRPVLVYFSMGPG
jgi:cytochrome oxidase Cu insertion factor (SCO1/SenC/PrrC family)